MSATSPNDADYVIRLITTRYRLRSRCERSRTSAAASRAGRWFVLGHHSLTRAVQRRRKIHGAARLRIGYSFNLTLAAAGWSQTPRTHVERTFARCGADADGLLGGG